MLLRVVTSGARLSTCARALAAAGALALALGCGGDGSDRRITIGAAWAEPPQVTPVTDARPLRVLSGFVAQIGGQTGGSAVYVRVHDNDDPALLDRYVTQQKLAARPGCPVQRLAFAFALPRGTYFVRAFRDSTGPDGRPDGQPTLGGDAQAPARRIRVSDRDSSGHPLLLARRADTMDAYSNFAATIDRRAGQAQLSGDAGCASVESAGRCGGPSVLLAALRHGSPRRLGVAHVRLPDGEIVMLRERPCAPDDLASCTLAGVAMTHRLVGEAARSGVYTFFFQQLADDFVHVEVVTIAPTVAARSRTPAPLQRR